MNKNLWGVLVASVYIVLVIVTSKFVSKKGEEASRKYIHILLSNVWIIFALMIDSMYYAVILPAIFVVLNSLSYRFKLVKTMEREENDGFGTIYYAVSILILSICTYAIGNPMVGMIGMLSMGYGDGFAAIIGQKVVSREYKVGDTVKSIAGSVTMFLITLVISTIVLRIMGVEYFVVKALGISIVGTILEAVSIKGLDNITVPLVVSFLTYLCIL